MIGSGLRNHLLCMHSASFHVNQAIGCLFSQLSSIQPACTAFIQFGLLIFSQVHAIQPAFKPFSLVFSKQDNFAFKRGPTSLKTGLPLYKPVACLQAGLVCNQFTTYTYQSWKLDKCWWCNITQYTLPPQIRKALFLTATSSNHVTFHSQAILTSSLCSTTCTQGVGGRTGLAVLQVIVISRLWGMYLV